MVESLQEFYLQGGQIEDGDSAAPPEGYEPAREPQGPTPAHRTVDAGRQYEERRRMAEDLEHLLTMVQQGSELALEDLANKFASETFEIRITITEPLKDSHGKTPSRFGLKVIESDGDLAELMQDYAIVAGYFPNLEIQVVPTTKRGKQLAVVMGITARDFNAVVSAVRHRERLRREMDSLDLQIRKGRKEMDVEHTPVSDARKEEQATAQTATTPAKGESASGGKGTGGKGGGKGGGAAKG